jgi:hypothetical protein
MEDRETNPNDVRLRTQEAHTPQPKARSTIHTGFSNTLIRKNTDQEAHTLLQMQAPALLALVLHFLPQHPAPYSFRNKYTRKHTHPTCKMRTKVPLGKGSAGTWCSKHMWGVRSLWYQQTHRIHGMDYRGKYELSTHARTHTHKHTHIHTRTGTDMEEWGPPLKSFAFLLTI